MVIFNPAVGMVERWGGSTILKLKFSSEGVWKISSLLDNEGVLHIQCFVGKFMEIYGNKSSSKIRGEANLQTVIFSIFSRKLIIAAGEYCWGNILVLIQLKPTHTRFFEDKITGDGGQNNPFLCLWYKLKLAKKEVDSDRLGKGFKIVF